MNFNNSYRIYMVFIETHNPGRRPLFMSEGIKKAAYLFLQRGEDMRKQAPGHPSLVMDLMSIHDSAYRRGKRRIQRV